MRHLTIRLQLAWLTFVALVAAALVAALAPGNIVQAQFARDAVAFRESLPGTVEALNLLRAQLAADMVFLIAYGLLLRQAVAFVGPHRYAAHARRGAVVVMAADAVENLTALTVARTLIQQEPPPASVVFVAMNAAAVVKWAVAGLVMSFLAAGWTRQTRSMKRPLRYVGHAIAGSFALGGVASVLVALGVGAPVLRRFAVPLALALPMLAFLLQYRLLDMIGVMLRFAYLTRVPLLILFCVTAFGPVALGPAVALLGGILDVASAWGVAVVTAASLVLAFACGTQINLVRAYGAQRTFDPTLLVLRHRVLTRAVMWTVIVAAGSLIFSIAIASSRLELWRIALAAAAGVVFGVLFLYAVEWTAARWSTGEPGRPLPQLVVPFFRAPLLGTWLREAHEDAPAPAAAAVKTRAARWSIAGRVFGLASGYIEVDGTGQRRLLRGHAFATVQLLLSAAFYLALVNGKLPGTTAAPESGLWVPTAGSFVLLLLLASWALAGVTFFLDRYRLPLLTAIAALALVTGTWTWTDHIVPTRAARGDYLLATPGEVLAAYPQPLVVAAAGGGIQAGAWTARALAGVDEGLGGTLAQRLALVSGVSGGSLGALYYGAFEGSTREAAARAMEPSLDELASALISSDLLRVFGAHWGADRGEALERSWSLRLPTQADVSMRGWSERVRRVAENEPQTRRFPAFLFNTTVVETGQPAAFATTQFPTAPYRESFAQAFDQYPVVESVDSLFALTQDGERVADVGLQAVTAARMSAAFPYVSPAATIEVGDEPRYHLVDGGYYDNYGLLALSQWLDDALEQMTSPPSRVDVLIVRGLVGAESAVSRDLRDGESAAPLPLERATVPHQGWAWQLAAPPVAFLNTRSFGQWAGGNQVLKLLIEKWARRGVTIERHVFDYPAGRLPPACRIAPLSWKLSLAQQHCIHDGWALRAAEETRLWNARSR